MNRWAFLWKCYQAYRGDPKAALEVAEAIKGKLETLKK
jgi:hypothetical protein